MRTFLVALILLGAPLGAAAEPNAADTARIEQAYASRVAAQQQQDVEQRIAARAEALNNALASPVLGNPAGDVTIVEFFDYACPYCKAVEPRLETLLKSDRKVKLVLKEFPILTPQSMIATRNWEDMETVAIAKLQPDKPATGELSNEKADDQPGMFDAEC